MLILLSWHRHFLRDPEMAPVSHLYVECGGVERVPEVGHEHGEPIHQMTAPAIDVTPAPAPRRDVPSLVSHRLSQSKAELTSVDGTIKFAEKNANDLLDAIVERRNAGADVLRDGHVRVLVNSILAEQRRVVSYIHVVQDEEFLAKLVDINDKIIDVLNRLQLAAVGGSVKTNPLGTISETDEDDAAVQAFRRLSVQDDTTRPALSAEVDHAIVTHSGFATAAPSRGATVDDYNSESEGEDDIDLDAASRNTAAVQAGGGTMLSVPNVSAPGGSPIPHAADALAPSLADKLNMLGPAADKPE